MPEVEKQMAEIEAAEVEVKPGGVKYEVVLEDAKTTEAPEIKTTPTPSSSVQDIELKLKVSSRKKRSGQMIQQGCPCFTGNHVPSH